MREIPLLRIDRRHVQFGPFRLDTETGVVIVLPWPRGMDDRFPHGWRSLENPAWIPVAYSPSTEGGVWAVRAVPSARLEGGSPTAHLLFLDRGGEIRECLRVPRPRFRLQHRILVYGEWVLAFGQLIRNARAVGDVVPMGPDLLHVLKRDGVCMGPDGMLMTRDGMVFRPDGSSFLAFDRKDLRVFLRNASGIPSDPEIRFFFEFIAWDEGGSGCSARG